METKDPIWVKNENDWLKGFLLEKKDNKFIISIKDIIYEVDSYETRNDDKIDCQNNLINIPHLNEPSILNAINLRYNKNIIYTYTGKILISVNPFKNLGLYTTELINDYQNKRLVEPHLFQIANNTYSNFINDQTILVSGESGAGKTHATRSLMKFLAHVSSNKSNNNIQNKVIQSNPILEAFGNAKTLRNDNSSRFGKFIKLLFNKNNQLTGSQINTYLLEKTRVIHQEENERNFHIFYQLLESNKKDDYFLKSCEDYKYLNNKYILRNDDVLDKDDFKLTMNAFYIMGFTKDEIDLIFKTVASILHIGNINFTEKGIENNVILLPILQMLEIDKEILVNALCFRHLNVQDETYKIDLNETEKYHAKNSLCMKLYSTLFSFIVNKINLELTDNGDKFIGILDIFGFESFAINRFEQLCINYTNETLQQQFNKYIFKLEQIEYEKEGIDWQHITFPDNKLCLDMIAGKLGLIDMLDEESKIPKGSSKNFTNRFLKKYKENDYIRFNRKYRDSKFGIIHYAGNVEYNTDEFFERNMDKISNEINSFVNKLAISDKNNKLNKTVLIQFRNSLNKLMSLINKTEPHYIRCIKPTDLNKPNLFDRGRVNDQLKYSGVLEAIRVARAGYPVRFKKELFRTKYRLIDNWESYLTEKEYCLGHTKVFLKSDGYEKLEDEKKRKVIEQVLIIQKYTRRYLCELFYKRIRKNIIILQSFGRIIIAKNRAKAKLCERNSIIIQNQYRRFSARQQFLNIKNKVILIQRLFRNYANRKVNKASTIIQKHYRRFVYQDKYEKLKKYTIFLQSKIRQFLKEQGQLKNKARKLKRELEKEKQRLLEIERQKEAELEKEKQRVLELERQQLFVLEEQKRIKEELKRKQRLMEEEQKKNDEENKKIKDEMNIIKDGMERSINEKIDLTKRLAEVLLENDRIKREQIRYKQENEGKCIIS